jgi:hypothetical protein
MRRGMIRYGRTGSTLRVCCIKAIVGVPIARRTLRASAAIALALVFVVSGSRRLGA